MMVCCCASVIRLPRPSRTRRAVSAEVFLTYRAGVRGEEPITPLARVSNGASPGRPAAARQAVRLEVGDPQADLLRLMLPR
jgi:hypothetical protein